MKKYERVAGVMTREETYRKLCEELVEVEELCAMMAHLHAAESDTGRGQLLATGWRAMSQMIHLTRDQVSKLAAGKLLRH
jgi:hypothetical protein